MITGNVRAFEQEIEPDGTATFTVNSNSAGTVAKTGSSVVITNTDAANWLLTDEEPQEALTTEPWFLPGISTIWINGSPYLFDDGVLDSEGGRVDQYTNSSAGTFSVSGSESVPGEGVITLSYLEDFYSGTLSGGVVSVSGIAIELELSNLPAYPPAFWIQGVWYAQDETTPTNYVASNGGTLVGTVSGDSITLQQTEASDLVIQGSFTLGESGILNFTNPSNGDAPLLAFAANLNDSGLYGDGELWMSAAPPSEENFPPAIRVEETGLYCKNMVFLGVGPDDSVGATPGTTVAFYGVATDAAQSTYSLKLKDDDGIVTAIFTNYALSESSTGRDQHGTFDLGNHLFQTQADADALPMPIWAVDTQDNYRPWGLSSPLDDGLPLSFIVHGDPWWYAGQVNGLARYQGYYVGQELLIGDADNNGDRPVTLNDPVTNPANSTTYGTLSGIRGSVRLRDGTLALSGTELGTQAVITFDDQFSLTTIASDLDIVGNNVSFGILDGDASLAGVLYQFVDDSVTSSLYSVLSRPSATWTWWKGGATPSDPAERVMLLDESKSLKLFPPGETQTPSNPWNPSSLARWRYKYGAIRRG